MYHVLNRSVARLRIFKTDKDYAAFERVLAEAQALHPLPLLSYCIMPNHWHLVVRPRGDDDLTAFMRWMTHTHVMRWHAAHKTVGTGPLYQGRFKAFAVQADEHFLTLCRYVERNAMRAGLVVRAEDWRWCSLWRRGHADMAADVPVLDAWPVNRPRNWAARVNEPVSDAEQEALRRCMVKGRPFGGDSWSAQMVKRLGLQHTQRDAGRPRKK